MVRLKNKSNYICMTLSIILEILGAIGAYTANYFTRTRMGMLRHMVYLNGKWEKALPILTIKWIAISIIIVLVIVAYLRYRNGEIKVQVSMIPMILNIIVSAWTVYFLLVYSAERNRAYYILSICFILMTVFQNIIYHCIYSIKSRN